MEAPIPRDEPERLATLEKYDLLDTLPEASFDRLVALAARTCGTPAALFSLVDRDRQWFKARIGIEAAQTGRDVSFCAHAVANNEFLIVEDATKDERFADNLLVIEGPGIRFYAGVPVHAGRSQPLGTLCVIDFVPRRLSDEERGMLESLAAEIEAQLELRQSLRSQQELIDERAILTHMVLHDASGMLASIRWSFKRLAEESGPSQVLAEVEGTLEELMRLCKSVADINETQSRQVQVNLQPWNLNACLSAIARRAETKLGRFGATVALDNRLPEHSVETDAHLLERMIDNLVNNAAEACEAGASIRIVGLQNDASRLEIRVEDDGPGIDDVTAKHIFEPYFSRRRKGPRGSGLGLAFCRLAANSLGGSIRFRPRAPHGADFIIDLPAN